MSSGTRKRAPLADFGIARTHGQADGDTLRLTGAGMLAGTVDYVSPEQAEAMTDIDGRSDLYSLGCVAFELLTGRSPYAGRSAAATIAAHLIRTGSRCRSSGPIPRLSSRC